LGAWNFQRPRTLTGMTEFENRVKPPVSREEREAKLQQRRFDAEQAIIERKKADAAFRANFERLKAERLAREAVDS
jgi:hypothetical protein